jgi:2,4-dienoyl-CoA reductase (NADPH2)
MFESSWTDRPTPLLRNLFTSIAINSLKLPNRVLMSSMHLNLDEFADAYERMARFYCLRARENIGLMVTAGCSPNAAGRASLGGFALDSDERIGDHLKITSSVHHEGGRIALQILHFGREGFHGGIVSASAERLASNLFTPRALTEKDIQQTILAFASSAARAQQAEYDAIELIFSQGFLVHQFLAPACNKRSDDWGGSFENRSRLAVEIAAAARAAVGHDYPLIFRIPCMDLLEGGLTAEESLALIERLVPYGVDLLNVSVGWHESSVPTIAMTVPRAAFASAAHSVRKHFPALRIAVSNRINDPRLGEQLLIDGCADIIAMGRPFLADPALMTKARANHFDQINTCIACNQSCLDYVFSGQPVGCSVNPDCGLAEEGQYPPLQATVRVAVVGGGIAGLGAALFMAKRGAQVVLYEVSDALGGQLKMAARVPGKEEFKETIRYYSVALLHAGVRVLLGRTFDEVEAETGNWDHVVLAQGSTPRWPVDLPGIDLPQVIDYTAVLEGQCPVTFPVVVIGGGGVACDIAKYLVQSSDRVRRAAHQYLLTHSAAQNIHDYLDDDHSTVADVTLLQRSGRKFAHRVGRTTRWILMQTLEEAGVKMRNNLEIRAITNEGVIIVNRTKTREERLEARTVIVAAGQVPAAAPIAALERKRIPYTILGSASEAGERNSAGTNLTSALRSAYRWAMKFSIVTCLCCCLTCIPAVSQAPRLALRGDLGTEQAYGTSPATPALSRFEVNLGVSRNLGSACEANAAFRVRGDQHLSKEMEYDYDLRTAWLTCRKTDWLLLAVIRKRLFLSICRHGFGSLA